MTGSSSGGGGQNTPVPTRLLPLQRYRVGPAGAAIRFRGGVTRYLPGKVIRLINSRVRAELVEGELIPLQDDQKPSRELK